jgi:hypothetical protein
VDVNVGQDRCGVDSPKEALNLARLASNLPGARKEHPINDYQIGTQCPILLSTPNRTKCILLFSSVEWIDAVLLAYGRHRLQANQDKPVTLISEGKKTAVVLYHLSLKYFAKLTKMTSQSQIGYNTFNDVVVIF